MYQKGSDTDDQSKLANTSATAGQHRRTEMAVAGPRSLEGKMDITGGGGGGVVQRPPPFSPFPPVRIKDVDSYMRLNRPCAQPPGSIPTPAREKGRPFTSKNGREKGKMAKRS